MAITKPPSSSAVQKAGSPVAFISRAGNNGQSPKEVAVTVRIPEDMLQQIDELVAARRVKTSRNTWLAEAVVSKLDAETGHPPAS